MGYMFEDDVEEIGSEIEAYCPKDKADTTHTIITKYEDEVRRVQCNACGDVHSYRKPRGEIDDDVPEPMAARRRATTKKPTWEEAMASTGEKALDAARPYSIRDTYTEGDVVSHPKFGIGFVTEITENKAEVTFKDERRLLVHNRPDLATQMPAIAAAPPPRQKPTQKKSGRASRGERGSKKGSKPAARAASPRNGQSSGQTAAPEAPADAKARIKAAVARVKKQASKARGAGAKSKATVKAGAQKTKAATKTAASKAKASGKAATKKAAGSTKAKVQRAASAAQKKQKRVAGGAKKAVKRVANAAKKRVKK